MFNVDLRGNSQLPPRYNQQNDDMDVDTAEDSTPQNPPSPRMKKLEAFLKGSPESTVLREEITGIDLFESGTLSNLRTDVNFELLAHIFGDSCISDSSLEGGNLSRNLRFVIQALQHGFSPSEFTKKLIDRLQDVIDIQTEIESISNDADVEKLVQKIIKKLNELKEKEEFLFPGGWISENGGHAILYEVERVQDAFQVSLINTGEGIKNHASTNLDVCKYVDPYFVILNVKKQRLLSPDFWQFAIALVAPPNKQCSHFDSDSVYTQLIHILGATSMGYFPGTTMKPQNAGTCTWKVIVAYLKDHFNLKTWHQVNLMIKFFALGNYLRKNPEITSYAQSVILNKGEHGLANVAKKYYQLLLEEPPSSNEEQILLEACSLAEHVKALVQSKGLEPFFRKTAEHKENRNSDCIPISLTHYPCYEIDHPLHAAVTTNDAKKTSCLKPIALEGTVFSPPQNTIQDGQILPFLTEWKQFLIQPCPKEEKQLVLWHFERMWQSQPLELPRVKWTVHLEQQFLSTLSELAKIYFIEMIERESSITQSLTGWHLFIWMSQIAFKRLSSEMPHAVNFDQWGICAPWFDSISKKSILDLSNQHRIREFQVFIQRFNQGKTHFLYDTIEKRFNDSVGGFHFYQENDANQYGDFILIKRCLKHSSNKNARTGEYFKNICSQFGSRPAKGAVLPKEYYQLREVYFLALCPWSEPFPMDQNFQIGFHLYPSSLGYMFQLKRLGTVSGDKKKGKKRDDWMMWNVFGGVKVNNNPNEFIFYNIGQFLSSSSMSQNVVRSKSKGTLLLPSSVISRPSKEMTTMPKYEMNKMIDINSAKQGELALCVNYYLENPPLFFKDVHSYLFFTLFYKFCRVEDSLRDMPVLRRNFHVFVENFFFFFEKRHESSHYYLVIGVSSAVIQYLALEPDKNLFSLLIHSLLKIRSDLLRRKLSQAEKGSVREIEELLLKAYSFSWITLTKEDVTQILSISGIDGSHRWQRSTFPLFIKLEQFLRDESTASEILEGIETIACRVNQEKLNHSEELWKKETSHFKKSGWTFDLYTNTLSRKDFGKLDILLNISLPGLNHFTKYRDLIDDLSDFAWDETERAFINSNHTVRISERQCCVIIAQILDGSWCEFQYCGTLNRMFGKYLGDSTDVTLQSLQWYKKVAKNEVTFFGKLPGKGVAFELTKVGKEWKILDRKKKLLYGGSFHPNDLPDPLNRCMYSDSEPNIACWIDASNHKICEIIIKSPKLRFVSRGDDSFTPQRFDGDTLFEGYTLTAKTIKSPFLSVGPFFPLQDAQGTPFILIPHLSENPFLSTRKAYDPLCPTYTLNGGVEDKHKWRYSFYKVDEKTHDLVANDLCSQIFLCYLYFIDQNWEKCFSLLEKCKQTYPYSDEERVQFGLFFSSVEGRQTLLPHQCVFLLKLALQFMQHGDRAFLAFNQEALWYKKIVSEYVRFYQTIPPEYRLSLKEEQALIALSREYQVDMKALEMKSAGQKSVEFWTFDNLFEIRGFNDDFKISILKNAVKKFNYQEILKGFSPFTLSLVKEKGNIEKGNKAKGKIELLSDQVVLALWMGILSDNDQEFTNAASKICFHNKRTEEEQFKFLRLALLYSEPYKRYLVANGVDYGKPKAVLDNWPKFVESMGGNLNTGVKTFVGKYDNGADYLLARQLFPKPLVTPSSSYKVKSLLSPYPFDEHKSEFLITCRKKILETYYTVTEVEEPASFNPLDLTDETQRMLDAIPIAKQLYTDLIKPSSVSTQIYQFNSIESLQKVLAEVQALHAERLQMAKELGCQIEKEVNATPLDQGETLTLQGLRDALSTKLNQLSHHQRMITNKDLVIRLLEQNWDGLNQENPYLSEDDSQVIFHKTIDWMLLEIEVSLLEKVIKSFKDLAEDSKTPAEENAALEQAAILLSTERHFVPMQAPHLLAFEYLAGVILRKSQIEKINELVTDRGSHEIVQLMMGDGKTGVMLPYLAKMLANGKRLPIILAPRSLYQEYLKIMKAVSQNELMQKVHVLEFNRSSSTTTQRLGEILELVKKARDEKGLLICTPETAKALLLKYEELLVLEEESLCAGAQDIADLTSRRKTFQGILQFLARSGCALIDEAHLAMKSLQEMNFTLAKSKNPDRWEIEMILTLYTHLVKLNFDFSKPLPSDPTSESDSFIEWRDKLIQSLFPLEKDREIRNYLQGKNEEFFSKISHSNPDFAKKLALLQQEIGVYLGFTLSRALNRHYGRHPTDPGLQVAIPYIGARTPNPRSLFSHKYVMLNYTIQMTLQQGLQKDQFITWFKKQDRLWDEIATSSSVKEADLQLKRFFGRSSIKDFNIEDPSILNKLYDYFYQKKNVIFDYLSTVLLPSVEIHTDKLTATEQELGDLLFNQVMLFTGTPYNAKCYSRPFQKVEDKIENVGIGIDFEDELFQDQETVSATNLAEDRLIAALCRSQNSRIEVAKEATSESALLAIQAHDKKAKHQNLSAFIDTGAFCKDVPASIVTKLILDKIPRVEGVLFFEDNSDKLLVLVRRRQEAIPYIPGSIPLAKVFVYLDHMHSFGADLVLAPTAEAMVTVNQTCFFELKQGIKRMRQIERLQTVTYLIPEILVEQCQALTTSNKLSIESLSLQSILNEAKLVEHEIILATLHELKLLVKKKALRQQLVSPDNLGYAKAVLVENIDSVPSGKLIKKIKPVDMFTNYINHILVSMSFVAVDWDEEVAPVIERAVSLLPDLIDGYAMEALDQMQEVEKQQEQIKKVEILNDGMGEFEPDEEKPADLRELLINGPKITDLLSTLFSMEGGLSCCYRLNDFISLLNNSQERLFAEEILITRNFAKTAAVEIPSWSRPIKPVDYFLYLENGKGLSYFLIITLEEMGQIFCSLKKDQEGPMTTQSLMGLPWKATLFNMQGQACLKDCTPKDPTFNRALVQMRTFDERNVLSPQEEAILLDWSRGKEGPLLTLLEKLHINREKGGSFKYGAIAKALIVSQTAQRSIRLSNIAPTPLAQQIHGIKRPAQSTTVSEEEGMTVDTEEVPQPPKKKQK